MKPICPTNPLDITALARQRWKLPNQSRRRHRGHKRGIESRRVTGRRYEFAMTRRTQLACPLI